MSYQEAGEAVGRQLIAKVQSLAGNAWGELDAVAKDQISAALHEQSQLLLLKMGGDLTADAEIAHVRAAILNWEFVAADQIREAINGALLELGDFVVSTLLNIAKGGVI